ncbi:COBRA-like protein 1 [Stylosanthes scabra]|uniref:COBRA-like protein 1 n=1 Tax=Stylosanthes scabra TaxID=79078 RepID=A0ABU6SE28_9FABA|nr:COBRA-like protein 1 [Stylosanthes scabra]
MTLECPAQHVHVPAGPTQPVSNEDMAMFWGIKFYNNVVIEAGRHGNNVEFEVLFRKDNNKTLSSKKGWAFPQGVYFNGDQCVMPPPHSYPWLPNA